MTKTFGVLLLAAVAVGVAPRPALAQEKFPSKQVDVVIPFAAGGNTEINAQLLRPTLQKALGVGVPVVLTPGGSRRSLEGLIGHGRWFDLHVPDMAA